MTKLIKFLTGLFAVALLVFAGYFSFSSDNMNRRLVHGLVAPIEAPEPEPQIAVVLGAGLKTGGRLTDIAQERVDHAVQIHEQSGLPVVFSGGDTAFGIEADSMNDYARENGYEGPDHIEGSSRSTFENALFTDRLLDASAESIESDPLLIITSPYHSRRALATFRTIMPERGVFITYPESSTLLDESLLGRWKGLRMILREYAAIYWYEKFRDIEFAT